MQSSSSPSETNPFRSQSSSEVFHAVNLSSLREKHTPINNNNINNTRDGQREQIREEEEEEEEEESRDRNHARARRLMEEEERAHSERMLAYAGVNQNNMNDIGMMNEDIEDDDVQDPDDMTYEELLQLGDVVGRQATGMDSAQIKKFCLLKTYEKKKKTTNVVEEEEEEEEEEDSCSVCRCEFESGEMILMMKCKHGFHEECLRPWLKEYKTCPLCKTECM